MPLEQNSINSFEHISNHTGVKVLLKMFYKGVQWTLLTITWIKGDLDNRSIHASLDLNGLMDK